MYTWGTGVNGELGIEGVDYSNVPNQVKTTKCSLVAKVQCGPSYTAFVDYNGNVFYFGRIMERTQVRASFLNIKRNYKENSILTVTDNCQSDSGLFQIENITAKDIFCGVNLIAIIDLSGNLFIYNEEEKLCKVKVSKPIQSLKFIYSNFYAISKDKETLYEFVQKGVCFSFVNFVEKTFSVDKEFCQTISLVDLPYNSQILFFMIECLPSKKEEIEGRENKIFTLAKNKKEYTEKFNTDDESNSSFYKDSLNMTNTKSEMSRMNKYSESICKKIGNISMQHSNFEDSSVYPPNPINSKQRELNRDYSQQSQRSSRLSCNNSRISKISDLLGKIFDRKLSQITTLNNKIINRSCEKNLIAIERLSNVAPINKKQEIIKKNENTISKIIVSDNIINASAINSPEIFNKNKPIEKKFFISPYAYQTEEKQRKTNFSNANDYKKIVKKINFNNIQPQSESNVKENKINIIKLDFSRLKNLDRTDNEIRSLNVVKFESPPLTNNSLSNVKAGFNFDSIKICTIKDNYINLNTNDLKELHLNNKKTDRIELSILSNRERPHAKDSNVNSNGKSSTLKNQNVSNFCDVSHVSNGKPDVNSNTEEVSELNSDLLNMTNKEKENENSIQNIGSESFNIQIKEIFYDDCVNMGAFAFSSEFNKINEGLIEKANIAPTSFEFNKYRRNIQNKIPKPNQSSNVNADMESTNDKNVGNEVMKKYNKMQTNHEIVTFNVERINSINILDKTNGKSVENLNPDQSAKILNVNNMIFSFCSPSNDIPKNENITENNQNMSCSIITSMRNKENELNKNEKVIPKELCNKETNGIKIPTDNMLVNNLNEQLLNRTADMPDISKKEETFGSTMYLPSQLYKRKSSISSFKTAKKGIDSCNNPNVVKRLILANKDKYFPCKNINEISYQSENNSNKIATSELTRTSLLDNTMPISDNPKSPPKLIIKKIVEVQTGNKTISSVSNFKESKRDQEESFNIVKDNERDSKKITRYSSTSNLSRETSNNNLNCNKNQINIEQQRNANSSGLTDNKNIVLDVLNKEELPDHLKSEDLKQKSKIQDALGKDKLLSLKTISLKPSPSTKISPKEIIVIQHIDTSKSSSYINFNQPQSFRVPMIDPIIEAEAICENSFMTAYNHTEEKHKKENNLKGIVNQNNEIIIRDNMQPSKDNRLSDSNKTDKNKSFFTENRDSFESSRFKENRKKDTTESNKFQLNTISSIIQNSKRNSAAVPPINSYSIFTKLKDSNTPVNSSYVEKTGTTVIQQKKSTESGIKTKVIDIKGIKKIKISEVTPGNSNNTKRLISNSNSNYRGSIKSKNNPKKELNCSNDNRELLRDSSNNVSCLNANNKTENVGPLDESNLNENESIINPNKKLEKSNTHKILSLKIKQDVKRKNSPKQININYLKSPEGTESIGQFSKTGSSFNKRSTIEKSRKSSILSKVKSSGQQQTMNKSKRDSMREFQTNQIDAKGKTGNEMPYEIEEYQVIKTPKKKSSLIDISPNSLSKLKINKACVNSLKNLNTIFAMDSNSSMPKYINSYKESQCNPNNFHKARSVANFKISRNPIKGLLNYDQPIDNDDSNRELKISNFNYKNSDNNIRYTDSVNEPDNELMTKFLKDLYESYKENENLYENENFEDYVKRIISNQEMTAQKKFETSGGRQSLYKFEEEDNLILLEDEQQIKNYLRNKFKEGNISPKLTFCLTPTKFLSDDDYKDRTSIFEPLELDKSQITQRSINLSCRKSSSLPHRTNSMDFSNTSSPKKFLIPNDIVSNIHPFSIIDDKDLRNANRSLVKLGTFSHASNEEQLFKLNSIRENALENESSPTKYFNDSRVVEDKEYENFILHAVELKSNVYKN